MENYMYKFEKVLIFLLFIDICTVFIPIKVHAEDNVKKQVLILQSYHEEDPWEQEILQSIKNTFKNKNMYVDINVEYMDMRKHFSEEYLNKLANFYKEKYKKDNFDVIITCDNDAFNFMGKYHDSLFKDTPVVFCGVNGFKDDMIKDKEYFTGVSEEEGIEETLDLAIKQNEDAREVGIVIDYTATGMANKEIIENFKNKYKDKLKINIIQGKNIKNVEEEIGKLDKNSFIFLLANLEDEHGTYMSYTEVSDALYNKYHIPMYSCWDSMINHGVIGGLMVKADRQGEMAAGMAYKIINGQKPFTLAVVKERPNEFIFDYNIIENLNIKPKYIPVNSKIINKPSEFYSIHKYIVLGIACLLIVVLTVVVIMLSLSISIRKEAEEELQESEEQLRTLINSLPNIICFKDEDGKWLQANKTTLELYNLVGIDYKGKTDQELSGYDHKHKLDVLTCKETDKEAWEKGEITIGEETLERNNGEEVIYDFIKIPVFHTDGSKKGIVVIGNDITERKYNEELRHKDEENRKIINETLEYDKIKTEFFSNISHELKTPLNVIFSTTQLFDLYSKNGKLIDNGVNIAKKTYILKQNCFRLLRLVNNLIDITKLDTGYFEVHLKNRDIVSVVEEITLSVADFIENKGIELIFDTDVEEKIMACDEDKIERIMLNLLSNAIKFTPTGGKIMVNMYDGEEYIKISVKDTGIGIPEDKQKMIFERFRQVDKSLARNREGSGIGLSLVKSLIELHKGTIDVRSEYGEGSEFIIRMPITLVEDDKNITDAGDKAIKQSPVERINLEFSDIYS